MGAYAGFFSVLNRKECLKGTYFKCLVDKNTHPFEKEGFWKDFGYTYFGIFSLGGENRENVLRNIPEEFQYAKNIFKAAYFSDGETGVLSLNASIVGQINLGRQAFTDDAKKLSFSRDSTKVIKEAVIEYFQSQISKYEEIQIMQLYKMEKTGEQLSPIPVNRNSRMHMGVINPWPGDLSAESEVLIRTKKAAEDAGIQYTMLSDFGHMLDEKNQKKTQKFVNAKELDFVVTTHYVTPKCLDSFYYHALWNPPEIPLNLGEYNQFISNNYIMNDDYLTYDTGGMKNHLLTMLMNKPRSLDGTSMLTASFPTSAMLQPSLDDPKMFYCGMNWDKLVNNQNRHEGLFKLLDRTDKVKFFGPDIMKNWGGMRPWEGYKCYQHSIPWDGFSILDEINQCGVCLVISSDIHRRAGAVTNRAYEACAAGALMISDNNEFMLKYFSDSALFIYYNRNNPEDTYHQIMEKYEWIVTHKEEALAMIHRAQKVFRDKFALDKQLLNIVSNHPKRVLSIANDLFAKDDSKKVLVTFIVNTLDEKDSLEKVALVIENVKNQFYRNIQLVIAADSRIQDCVKKYADCWFDGIIIKTSELFDEKGARNITDGQAIRQIQKEVTYDYFVNTSAGEHWFYDHITTLVRSIEDDHSYGAYSGRSYESEDDGLIRLDYFNMYSDAELSSISDERTIKCPGQFMFTESANKFLPDYVFDNLDGLEHYAYANIIQVKHDSFLSFSRRMTCIGIGRIMDERCSLIDFGMQVRLIQDMVRFDLKRKKTGGENITFNPIGQMNPDIVNIIKDTVLKLPVKTWLSYKKNLVIARLLGRNTSLGKRYMDKSIRERNNFFKYWG